MNCYTIILKKDLCEVIPGIEFANNNNTRKVKLAFHDKEFIVNLDEGFEESMIYSILIDDETKKSDLATEKVEYRGFDHFVDEKVDLNKVVLLIRSEIVDVSNIKKIDSDLRIFCSTDSLEDYEVGGNNFSINLDKDGIPVVKFTYF